MTTYHDEVGADLSNNMQNIVVEETCCPKCQKGKLRPTYLNVDLDLIWLCSKCLYPLEENNLNDHIISSRASTVLPTRQMRKRKLDCESTGLMSTETTSSIYNNNNITQAELEDINTCSQLNKKARLNDSAMVWSDTNDTLLTRVNNSSETQLLIDDTTSGSRGELLTFDLHDVT